MTVKWRETVGNRAERTALASLGLSAVSLGVYFQIQANLGIAPWNALNQGIALRFPVTYGTAYILVSCLVLAADLCFRESIGVGMLLDTFLVGWVTDLLIGARLLPAPSSIGVKIVFLLAGMVITCIGQLIYMKSALGCGPRDAMLVALGRSFPRLTVGTINLMILVAVTALSFLMGAPIGIGTLITAAFTGLCMDLVFRAAHFDPCSVRHENLLQTCQAVASAFGGSRHNTF